MLIDIILDIIMMYNTYHLLNKIENKESTYKYIYPLYIIFIAYNTSFLFDLFIIKQLLIISSFIAIYLYELLIYKKISKESFIEILIASFFLDIDTMIYSITNIGLIKSYIIISIVSFLSFIKYLYTNKDEKYPAYIFSISLMLAIIDFIAINNLTLTCPGYSSLVLIVISIFLKKESNLKKSLQWIGNATFIGTSLLNYNNNIYLTILYLTYIIITALLFYKEKNNSYKILSYIYTNFALISFLNIINVNNLSRIVPITTIIYILLEHTIKQLDEKINNYYILIQFIISFMILNVITNSIINLILLIIIDIIFIYYINKHKWSNNYLYIPFIFTLPYIYTKDILIYNDINFMYPISFCMLGGLVYQIYNKKENIYIHLYYLYTIYHMISFSQSKYLNLALITIAIIAIYSIKEGKIKEICKGIIYTNILILFQFIISDLNIRYISLLNYGSYLIWIPFITRTIIKKYNNDYKIIEYLGYIIINLICILNYSSEFDGIMFVFFLTIIVIISYLLKFGPIFLVSLLAILLNVLLLTRTFWLNIPWWLYILLIGSILVIFSIYNEMSAKKDKEKLVDKMRKKLNL